MTCNPIIEEMLHLAINPKPTTDIRTTDIRDPRYLRYLSPLDSVREEVAVDMAGMTYGAYAAEFDDSTTQAKANRVYEQCLVDARRMLCDQDYMHLFDGGDD